jgi:hypothetical protein
MNDENFTQPDKLAPAQAAGKFSDFEEIGAGEGIRTLDPDLGKVVLYP